VNRSKSDTLFKKSAQKLEEALKAAGVNLEVITNPEKPRKGSFEVQDDKGNKYVSLQNLSKPEVDGCCMLRACRLSACLTAVVPLFTRQRRRSVLRSGGFAFPSRGGRRVIYLEQMRALEAGQNVARIN
jgi:hypothetical protein